MATDVSYHMHFSPSQTRSLIVVPVFALLSASALSFIVYRCIRLVVIPSFRPNATTLNAPENLFFRTHLGRYAVSLVFSNVVLTSAGLMEFFWVKHSGIYHGPLCNVQATLMQTGSWATCFFSVAIGIHTCTSLVFRLRQINWVTIVVIAFGWIASLVIGMGPLTKNDVYGPVIVSCGVTLTHPDMIFWLKSFPVLFGSVLAVLVYSFIWGVLSARGRNKYTSKPQEQLNPSNNSEEYVRFMGAIANSMLWYPVAFVLLLLPFTIANLIEFRGQSISFGFDVFVHACWSILGLVNVALLYNTFRVLSPVFHGLKRPKIEVDTERSFGNSALDESPILPPAAHNPKGALLPLYLKGDNSRSASESSLSLSEFPEVTQHSRNSSRSSADSMTYLLSVKRKPSKFHNMRVKRIPSLSRTILPATEPNHQLVLSAESNNGRNLQLDLPMVEVNAARPILETRSLSPPPHSAAASVINPFPAASLPAKPPPMRQFTSAFGRPTRNLKFGPRSKDGTALPTAFPTVPPLSPIPSVASSLNVSETSASRFRKSSASSDEERKLPQLDLTGITPVVPLRPLPPITAAVERSPTPPVQEDIISERPSPRIVVRPLPQFPHDGTGSPPSNNLDEGAHGNTLPEIPPTQDNTSEENDSAYFGPHGRDLPSKRMTQTSVWSQESPTSAGHAPDMEAALAQLLGRA